jgi:hypothetical protein
MSAVILEAFGYSSTYKADYLTALYGNTTSNSTVAINADYTPSAFQLGSFAVRQTVPVTVSKAGITTCRSYGDPHISTFDKLSYGFQKAGGWGSLGTPWVARLSLQVFLSCDRHSPSVVDHHG